MDLITILDDYFYSSEWDIDKDAKFEIQVQMDSSDISRLYF